MQIRQETADILALLNEYTLPNVEDIAKGIAADFKNRRIEKNLTREEIAANSGVALSNVARFEQKGLISLSNLILLAKALGYLAEVKGIFSQPKYATMQELTQIRENMGRKKAYPKKDLKK